MALTCSLSATKSASSGAAAGWRERHPGRVPAPAHRLSTRWFDAYDPSRIVRIDATNLDYVEDLVDLIELTQTLDFAPA